MLSNISGSILLLLFSHVLLFNYTQNIYEWLKWFIDHEYTQKYASLIFAIFLQTPTLIYMIRLKVRKGQDKVFLRLNEDESLIKHSNESFDKQVQELRQQVQNIDQQQHTQQGIFDTLFQFYLENTKEKQNHASNSNNANRNNNGTVGKTSRNKHKGKKNR
jgi:hypothetical protein